MIRAIFRPSKMKFFFGRNSDIAQITGERVVLARAGTHIVMRERLLTGGYRT